jgi:hypothetical protein
VRHILTSPSVEARSGRYIGEDDFDWTGLLAEAESMSGGERALIRIAHDLWEAQGIASVWEIPRRLDRRHFERVIDDLYIYRGQSSEPRPRTAEAIERREAAA